jgi:hypothetical protein
MKSRKLGRKKFYGDSWKVYRLKTGQFRAARLTTGESFSTFQAFDEPSIVGIFESGPVATQLVQRQQNTGEFRRFYLSFRPSVRTSDCPSDCPSDCLSLHLSVHLSVHLSIHLSIWLYVRPGLFLKQIPHPQPVFLSVRLSVSLSVRLSVCPTVCLSVCSSVRPSVRPYFHMTVRPSIRPSVHIEIM